MCLLVLFIIYFELAAEILLFIYILKKCNKGKVCYGMDGQFNSPLTSLTAFNRCLNAAVTFLWKFDHTFSLPSQHHALLYTFPANICTLLFSWFKYQQKENIKVLNDEKCLLSFKLTPSIQRQLFAPSCQQLKETPRHLLEQLRRINTAQ